MKLYKQNKGFTLVELLAVIVILAILVLLAVPSVIKMLDGAKENAFKVEAENIIKGASLKYSNDMLYSTPKTCYSLSELSDFIDKDFTGYNGSVSIDTSNNTYTIYLSNGKYLIDGSTKGDLNLIKSELTASNSCDGLSNILTINTNEGQIVGGTTIAILEGNSETINVPTRTDYIFDGWEVSGTGSTMNSTTFTMGSEDATITAKWLYAESILNGAYPRLDTGMIPVRISTTGAVTKADIKNPWYSYENKEWANVVLVSNGSRGGYQSADAGDPITTSDILAYFVWIPRYKYQMFNADGETVIDPSEYAINVVFESTNTPPSDGKRDGVYTNGEYLTHPAFTFGTEPLNGIWVGKFETTGSIETPTILPGITSLREQNVSTFFITSLKFGGGSYNTANDTYTYSGPNDYGLNHISRMAQDKDWGAIAYLTHSIYGRCTSSTSCIEISINNSSTYLTGSSAGRPGDATTNSDLIYSYNTTQGYLASTTANIYGVYDMSGGAWDCTMGVLNNYSGRCNAYNSGFNGTYGSPGISDCDASLSKNNGINFPESKYYTTYIITDSIVNFQTACDNSACYGSGLKETTAWFNDNANVVSSMGPWNIRGGPFNYGAGTGIWHSSYANGHSSTERGFRTVIGM